MLRAHQHLCGSFVFCREDGKRGTSSAEHKRIRELERQLARARAERQ